MRTDKELFEAEWSRVINTNKEFPFTKIVAEQFWQAARDLTAKEREVIIDKLEKSPYSLDTNGARVWKLAMNTAISIIREGKV